jgi:hypothetical protein
MGVPTQYASSRIDNGAKIYDGTRWREVPWPTLMIQNHMAHEIPVYGEILKDAAGQPYLAWGMHGPQEPLEIGVEAPAPLPPKGINPVTGAPRLQFSQARPVPWVHSIVVEWWDYKRHTWWHFEGGIRIHQVASKKVWYPKSSYRDDGAVSSDILGGPVLAISQMKVIFAQRLMTDAAGVGAIAGSATNWTNPGGTARIPGGPSGFVLEHRGTKHYPKFTRPDGSEMTRLTVNVNEATFNPGRLALLAPFINRQGMVADAEGMHECLHSLTVEQLGPDCLAPNAWTWSMGDELPHADVPATIQH